MSYYIRIFCQASELPTRHDIQEFVLGGIHFDKHPVFIPAFLDPDSMLEDWGQLDIIYDPDKRPIRLTRNKGDDLFKTEIQEINDLINSTVPPEVQQSLIDTINACNQIIAIEIKRESLSEDAWGMLDALESYLAGNLMGLVYAPDDGFYGSGLQLLYKIG